MKGEVMELFIIRMLDKSQVWTDSFLKVLFEWHEWIIFGIVILFIVEFIHSPFGKGVHPLEKGDKA